MTRSPYRLVAHALANPSSLASTVALLGALAIIPAPAAAQSSSVCYKGICAGLDERATGSNYGQLELSGIRPVTHVLSGTSGGDVDVSYLGRTATGTCVGYATVLPDHVIRLEEWTELRLEATSRRDVALVVHGPDGWLCNDDAVGSNPAISGDFAPGEYRVWVASYVRGYHDYELEVRPRSVGRPDHDHPDRWEPREPLPTEPWPGRPRPGRPPVYVPEPVTWSFTGTFEDVDVAFFGETPHDIYRECTAFASTSDSLGWVDDIAIAGRRYHYGASYWSADALCAIAALNATPSVPIDHGVSGMIEEVPFDVRCHGDEARRIVETYVPRAVGDMWIDDITVGTAANHNQFGYWSAEEAAQIIVANIVDPHALYVASGTIETTPFSFSGNSPAEIRNQCTSFVTGTMSDAWIDDVTVNGATRHNATGWWSATDLCMIVSSLAAAPY